MVTVAARATRLDDAALLFLKIFAFAWMVIDHADTMLLDGALGVHATVGRLVFPVFVVVLALNLARSEDPAKWLHSAGPRIALIGLAAMPAYVLLAGFYPLNVMFTLAAAVVVVACLQRGWSIAAVGVTFSAGLLVDYHWCGILAVVGAWVMARQGVHVAWLAAWAAVAVVPTNESLWALLAVPLVHSATWFNGDAPRLKWLFWAGYPAHLFVLAIIKVVA